MFTNKTKRLKSAQQRVGKGAQRIHFSDKLVMNFNFLSIFNVCHELKD